jgi:Kef-type K+ transport system membrane component KefB
MKFFKQPLIIGYIITGLIAGPSFFNILSSTETVELFSKIGITSLLFIVGLGLSPKVIKELGIVSVVTGFGQIIFTTIAGYIISSLLGFPPIQSLYIAIALTFSSTIIILKLLTDKGDINKLYGRITLGSLLIQDIAAALILVFISSVTNVEPGANLYIELISVLLKGFLLLVLLFFTTTYLLKKVSRFIGSSQEYLFVFGLSWGMAVASIYHFLGLSIEIGALVAGVSLSITPFSLELSSKLKPLRDFFIILFFILLGYNMSFDSWQQLIIPTAIFSIFILIGNPLIMQILLNLLGYTRKLSFMAGLTVAQISEFSLILISLGYSVGHLSKEIVSMITMIGIITIAGSSYMILYSEKLYTYIEKFLYLIEFRKVKKSHREIKNDFDAIIFGYRRSGPEIAQIFKEKKYKYLIVDFDPHSIEKLKANGLHAEYGDMSDLEFLNELPLANVKLIVSTVSDLHANLLFLNILRKINSKAVVIIIADTLDNSLALYESGATHVVLSHYIGAHQAANMILQKGHEIEKYEEMKQRQIKYLKNQKDFYSAAK